MRPLTERQLDVLETLASIKDRPSRNSRNLTNPEFFEEEVRGYWAAPMDFGGSDGSHHSATARALAKRGLIDRYKNGRINTFKSRNKDSCCYRINKAGIDYLATRSNQS
jgi:hypothetical protein